MSTCEREPPWPDTWQDVFYGEGEERRCGVNPSLLRDIRRLEDVKYGTKIGARAGRMDGGDGVSDGGGPALVRGSEGESSVVARSKRSCSEGEREIVLHLTRGADGYGFSLAAGNDVDAVKKGGAADEAQLRLGDRVVKVQGGKLLDGGGLVLEEPQDAGTRLSLTVRRHKDERKQKWQLSLRSGAGNVASDYEWPVVRWPVKNTAGLNMDTSEAGGTSREHRR